MQWYPIKTKDKSKWYRWFAWHPVQVTIKNVYYKDTQIQYPIFKWIWLEWVERKVYYSECGGNPNYRFIKNDKSVG